jgi:hypothetical protein
LSINRTMDAKDAIRRVLDGEELVEVKDRRGGGVVGYYRKADGLLYVCDRRGERPIMTIDGRPKTNRTPGLAWGGVSAEERDSSGAPTIHVRKSRT